MTDCPRVLDRDDGRLQAVISGKFKHLRLSGKRTKVPAVDCSPAASLGTPPRPAR